ncbi:hypothetical protein ACO229_00950 [Promicromonospora sp. MS192]|uniref:hypothetical protein n=1 Tax=Promicromonospora sp. MS192 TaxID=3412684 RepID=UPI003C2AB375
MRRTRHSARTASAALAAVLVPLLSVPAAAVPSSAGPEPAAATADAPPTEYEGEIAGAAYRVLVPEDWNGTLLLYSHGNYPSEIFAGQPLPHLLGNQPASEEVLTDHGYALAASMFQDGGYDFTVPTAVADQSRLLDWFEQHVGEPERTFTTGSSMGAVTALKHAEVEPDRIDGVLAIGGAIDVVGMLDTILDVNLATKVLLTDGTDANGNPIELVHPTDARAGRAALVDAVAAAAETPEGRAKIALIASLNDITGWYDVSAPEPGSVEDRTRGQAQWLMWAYSFGLGPTARVDWEAKLGGNASASFDGSWSRRLVHSGMLREVRAAYAAAPGADLSADLTALAAAPVIEADPQARANLVQHRPEGTTPSPVLTLHTTGDGGAPPSYERSFGDRVAHVGHPERYRNLYVERGAHLTVSLAEELVAVRALEERVESGRWPALSPRATNRAAWRLGPDYFGVFDPVTGVSGHEPAFTHFVPPRSARPSW